MAGGAITEIALSKFCRLDNNSKKTNRKQRQIYARATKSQLSI